ncbi:FkbM family methyltransferase [Campylobacter sp. MIT 12-5580]|uniref:FkbM family methyltransferase n=1 Tax=Campylobacter sp. MIT 12-5580 TaxID=2040651 RepID=UPI002016FFA8|nr:FkbM family methyltransferase [Campylobacter sp. MIT 12-5580]
MLGGGGIEFVRYVYKFLNFTYHRTHSIAELIDENTLSQSTLNLQILNLVQENSQKLNLLTHSKQRHLPGNFWMDLSKGKALCEESDIVEKVQKLLTNLDQQSKENVCKLLVRLKKNYLNSGQGYITLEEAEIKELNKIEHEFKPYIFELTPNVFCYNGYFLPIHWFEAGVFLYKHSLDILHPNTLKMMKEKDFIDVGGFIGDSAIIFENEFCNKQIHTFEASSKNFELLKQTLKLNSSKRIIPINKGLGSKNEINTIGTGFGSGASVVFKDQNNVEEVQIITLDEYVAQHKLEVGFIKVDIEGFEQEFLKGAKKTICEQKPAMLISIYHSSQDFFDIKPMIESWDLGYTFKIHRPTDTWNISIETALYCDPIQK